MAEPITNPDGTLTPALEDSDLGNASAAKPPWFDADPTQAIGSLFAAQIAMYRLLKGMRVQIGSFERLLGEGGSYGPTRELKLTEVYIDAPDSESEMKPLSACILERSPQLIDDDIKPYILPRREWHGKAIRCLGKMTCTLGVIAWFGHSNERRAFRTALQRLLMAEQKAEAGGRVIIVPEYFDAVVRFSFVDAQNVDTDSDGGLAEHRTLQLTVQAAVDELEAVTMPPKISAQFRPAVGVDVEP